jgi:hypothetical protein
MLPAETFEMRQHLSALSPAKLRWNAEAIFKIYEIFICGDMHNISNSFCKNVLNW